MIWFRRLHKWIGLAIGIQVALWMLSGLFMGLLDHDRVQGLHHRAEVADEPLSSGPRALQKPEALLDRVAHGAAVQSVGLMRLLDRPVYRVASSEGVALYDARSGLRISITRDLARRIALRDYSGPGDIASLTAVQAPSMEVRRHAGAVWRVDFDDPDSTSLYVSANDGSIVERRNDTWRLFDVFWMLHIMDYQEREDFNNALVILASLVAAWFSVTGLALFFDSFTREDFLALLPGTWWRKPARISVRAPHGEVVTRLESRSGGMLYDELAKGRILLPSNCGGGGTCGLCEVTLARSWPESAADLRLIPEHRRRQGVRLSCQAKVAEDMVVSVSDAVLAARSLSATVAACRSVTPFIREITLRVDRSFSYPAGSYVHVVIPPHDEARANPDTTDEIRTICARRNVPPRGASRSEIRRAYSLATPAKEHPGVIVLNVRFMLPPADVPGAPAGAGSSYMWSLKEGDHLNLIGPLGDFRARESGRDMLVIGGGAGMAPLRAIIREELLYRKSGRRIGFWYGARGLKDLLYAAEFDELCARYPNLSWQPVLSEPAFSDRWRGRLGNVHAAAGEDLLKRNQSRSECEFYVCGPPPMLTACLQMLRNFGVPESQIFFDDFGI